MQYLATLQEAIERHRHRRLDTGAIGAVEQIQALRPTLPPPAWGRLAKSPAQDITRPFGTRHSQNLCHGCMQTDTGLPVLHLLIVILPTVPITRSAHMV